MTGDFKTTGDKNVLLLWYEFIGFIVEMNGNLKNFFSFLFFFNLICLVQSAFIFASVYILVLFGKNEFTEIRINIFDRFYISLDRDFQLLLFFFLSFSLSFTNTHTYIWKKGWMFLFPCLISNDFFNSTQMFFHIKFMNCF